MAKNKFATIRYRIIDDALRGGKKVKSEEILEKIEDKLLELDMKPISKRQLSDDIKAMRYDEGLGFLAPIESDKNGYWYSKPNYSITHCPISKEDAHQINEALTTLEQFKEFGFYKELQSIITKVEQKISVKLKPMKPVIAFETVEDYEGSKHLGELYQAILKKQVLELVYTPFHLPAEKLRFHPQLLKEHNNRWFLFGINAGETRPERRLRALPLDRIAEFTPVYEDYMSLKNGEAENFFQHIIGVGLPWENQTVMEIILLIKQPRGQYLLTKPMHKSQKIIAQTETYLTLSLKLIPNREFYAQILWYGEDITVISPIEVRESVKQQLEKTMKNYDS
jgi:predicted DNA-binding transcriptional regulator YafY